MLIRTRLRPCERPSARGGEIRSPASPSSTAGRRPGPLRTCPSRASHVSSVLRGDRDWASRRSAPRHGRWRRTFGSKSLAASAVTALVLVRALYPDEPRRLFAAGFGLLFLPITVWLAWRERWRAAAASVVALLASAVLVGMWTNGG